MDKSLFPKSIQHLYSLDYRKRTPYFFYQNKSSAIEIMNFTVETHTISLRSKGDCDIINITNKVQDIIRENNFIEGSALIFVPGSTAGITTIEFEPGLLIDYPNFFDKIIPQNQNYHHDNTWHDGNGHSHVRASLQGASFTVPFKDKSLILGTWQQIVFVDFDNRARNREIIIQLTGIKE